MVLFWQSLAERREYKSQDKGTVALDFTVHLRAGLFAEKSLTSFENFPLRLVTIVQIHFEVEFTGNLT
jgi:hypothetical protein